MRLRVMFETRMAAESYIVQHGGSLYVESVCRFWVESSCRNLRFHL